MNSNGYEIVYLSETKQALDRALEKLLRMHPKWAQAFELRVVRGLSRDITAQLMDKAHRPETISDWVRKACGFLRIELQTIYHSL